MIYFNCLYLVGGDNKKMIAVLVIVIIALIAFIFIMFLYLYLRKTDGDAPLLSVNRASYTSA